MEKIYYLSFNGNDTEVMNMLLPYISEEKRIHIEEKSLVIDKLLVAYSNIFVKIALSMLNRINIDFFANGYSLISGGDCFDLPVATIIGNYKKKLYYYYLAIQVAKKIGKL